MQVAEVMEALEGFGSEQTRRIYTNHGVTLPIFGVKVADMKTILKKTKKDQTLAEELFQTGNGDAMYLAALMADEKTISADLLDAWAQQSTWYMVSEYGVAGVAAESPHGWELGLKWIESDQENVATAGWATLGGLVAVKKDADLDVPALQALLDRVRATIHQSSNRTRYTMNGFVIAVGSYVEALFDHAQEVAAAIGKVSVNMGNTACKVPLATEYLAKIEKMGRVGKKRKMVRC